MPALAALRIPCPTCASTDVVYTCSPHCCFNHVCAACQTTFEPVTSFTGRTLSQLQLPHPLPGSSDPAAPCARCQSAAVYQFPDGLLACADCGAELTLEITAVSPP
jgi:hypothetical protein